MPSPVSAMTMSTPACGRARADRSRPPLRLASRALVSRLSSTCSRSLCPQATGGRGRRRHVDDELDAASFDAGPENGQRRLDGGAHVAGAAAPHAAAGERQHAAEDPPAHLQRLLNLFEVSLEQTAGRVPRAHVVRHLLDQRQHRPERVVDVVRDTARQFGHGVFALGRQHPRFERLGAIQAVDGDRGLRSKAFDQLRIVSASAVPGAGPRLSARRTRRHGRPAARRAWTVLATRRRRPRRRNRATPPGARLSGRSTRATSRRVDRTR